MIMDILIHEGPKFKTGDTLLDQKSDTNMIVKSNSRFQINFMGFHIVCSIVVMSTYNPQDDVQQIYNWQTLTIHGILHLLQSLHGKKCYNILPHHLSTQTKDPTIFKLTIFGLKDHVVGMLSHSNIQEVKHIFPSFYLTTPSSTTVLGETHC